MESPCALEACGIAQAPLSRLVCGGLALRQSRGICVVAHHAPAAEHTPAQVAKRAPEGVFCLLPEMRLRGLTTQASSEVWVALPENARRPRQDSPHLRIARFSGQVLTEGI